MIVEKGLTKNRIVSELSRSPHGKLEEYLPIGKQAAAEQPEFFSHLIAWNNLKGQIRDSKVALPVISLSVSEFNDDEFVGNSLAHLAMLDPRNFVRAIRFAMQVKTPGRARSLRRLIADYLHYREQNWALWEKTAIQHRRTLKELYALAHVKPSTMADAILFKGERPKGTTFEAIAQLKNMSAQEAAGTIMERRIPFLIAMGALGAKAKEADLVLALIGRMSPTELVTNSKMLERLCVKTVPALRAAYEEALGKAAKSKKATLKTTQAAEAIEDDTLKAKLQSLQEKQLAALGGVDGNWLVLGDKSGSMKVAIEAARHVAATLAKMVKGQVHLVFFDVSPRYIDATGKSYEDLLALTKRVTADGGTSVGCGLQYCIDAGYEIDGIAIVSDGGENTPPMFPLVYQQYAKKFDKLPTVYFYRTVGDTNALSRSLNAAGIDCQDFDLTGGVDYYSLPNLVATMRVNRYSLIDEIMAVPLVKLEAVLPLKKGELVHA